MANRYLEKIAGFLEPVLGAGKVIARGATAAGKYVGKEVSTALGGGERAYLAKVLDNPDPAKVAKMGESFNSFSTRRQVIKERLKGLKQPEAGDHKAYKKNLSDAVQELRGLHKNKMDARIIVGTGAGAAYSARKKYKESHPDPNDYPATYYNYQ